MVMKKKIYIVVVVYNKELSDSVTIKKIDNINIKNIEIVVIDNSTISTSNEKIANSMGYHYLNMNGNKGLSKSYNIALNYINNELNAKDNDYILWMDDDTEISNDYLKKINNEFESEELHDIYAPIVVGQDGKIYSPNSFRYLKNKLIDNLNDIGKIKKYNAINSCLCVCLSVYKDYRYDEVLFLDQVDTNFFDDMRKSNKKMKTLDVVIHQNFSQRGTNLNGKKMIPRYKIRIKDIMRYGRKNIYRNFLSFIKSIMLSFQMGIKCKSISLIIICSFIAISMFFKNVFYLIFRFEYKF